MAQTGRTKTHRRRWHVPRFGWWILGVILFLVAVRAVLPVGIQWYVNKKLNGKSGYTGTIGDVDMSLIRGAYQIQNVNIFKSNGKVPVPFFAADKVDFSMQWRELWHGSLVGEIQFERGRMNFVAGPTKEESQTEVDKEWGAIIESLFPFKINRFTVRNSEIHFQNLHRNPKVDVYARDVLMVATNLTNARGLGKSMVAGIEASAHILEGGAMHAFVSIDPTARRPTFDLNLDVRDVNLVQLNDFLRAYGRFDVERGTFFLSSEIACRDGHYEGYIKPIFDKLDVLNFRDEKKEKKLTQLFWEALVGAVAKILENQPKDRLAAVIPVNGEFDSKANVKVMAAIGSLLKNEFIRALLPGVEGTVHLDANATGKKDVKKR